MQLLRLVSYVWRHPLNADGRLRAIGRILRWQFASRLLAGPIALPFVGDTRLFASRGMTGATGNWYCGLHEAEEMGFLLHYLKPDDLFVDIGANVGSYTVMVAGGVGASVVSIEPIPVTFSTLQANVLLNGLSDRVELHCMGLSNKPGELQFTADGDTVNHVLADAELGKAINITVMPLDDLLAGRVPSAIKIDVEGHERAVLEGALRTLSDQHLEAVVMEINGSGSRYGVSDDELLAIMDGYGFVPYGYDPCARSLKDWNRSSGNAIFLRNRAAADSRVAQAKRFTLVNGSI